jgi:hypothetical protein
MATRQMSTTVKYNGADLYVEGFSPIDEIDLDKVTIYYKNQDITTLIDELGLLENIVGIAESELLTF